MRGEDVTDVFGRRDVLDQHLNVIDGFPNHQQHTVDTRFVEMVIIITIKMTCLFHDFRKGSTPQLDGALHGSQRGAQRTDPDPGVLAGNVEVSGSLISSNLSDTVDGSEIRH